MMRLITLILTGQLNTVRAEPVEALLVQHHSTLRQAQNPGRTAVRNFIVGLITSLCFLLPVYADDTKVTLDRSWGLLIGDRIQARIELPVDAGQLDLSSLPQHHKRYGAWLYLDDSNVSGQTMTLFFQLINVPAENRQVATPEFELRTQDGEFINIPSVPMQIGSFLQTNEEGEARLLPRGDVKLQPESSEPLKWQLRLSIAVFILGLLIWLAWHFGLRPRQRLPFATAVFELNKMRLLRQKDSEAASRSLHHAFNRCAGRVVIHSQLNKLWQQCPWLEPVKTDIEGFYQQSAAHFFSRNAVEQKDFEQLLALARRCRAEEKMA
ncbi:hypothetical protein [Methylophaga sp. OBS4]|uniref:hypothetical protein n=1 Tax=Methylophaga sp. OBS4 TaxID=2991935 RepID=UPI00225254F9|nr:hypothetical protein [Methylophaga sp. OBS4]MCX4187123.1 hypothetical protein [Methylophaga sp. OBS4]